MRISNFSSMCHFFLISRGRARHFHLNGFLCECCSCCFFFNLLSFASEGYFGLAESDDTSVKRQTSNVNRSRFSQEKLQKLFYVQGETKIRRKESKENAKN